MTANDVRRSELADNLAAVRERIDAATRAAGRTDEVALTVVTKFFPADDVAALASLGVVDVGENRHQEAEGKHAACLEAGVGGLRWHFIGGLQSNKAAAVARWADVVESIDRPKLVGALDRGAAERDAPLDVLLQVSLDPPGRDQRAGVEAADLAGLAARVEAAEHLRLRGLMAVAPLGEEPEPAFGRLATIRSEFLADHPGADLLSAGMSGDLEAAIAHGATHVRVGTAVLGSRPGVQ
ncbi:YggS family pyridoxal phosphate-dependent enzyme [Nocardioides sambongensis]|uniref:YggS family pyridoxal phosphate-dependent enzyme n=1 Tax=Nocardioides sambongensis TaxID=2589074 RepID=UPI00112EABD2|nr:YggS family pyridoxal phosphate-dependent enzyme [Nocardioides sambongensis]